MSKILIGPNEGKARPDPDNPGKYLGHHYHVKVMQGAFAEAANYCGNIAKEGECPIFVHGELLESNQVNAPILIRPRRP